MVRFGAVLLSILGGCAGDVTNPDDFLGDHGFSIITTCPPDGTPCFTTCQNNGPDDVCGNSVPPEQGGCWITGGGFIVDMDGNDSFGGNGMPMKDGTIRGEWEHVDHGTGNKWHTQVRYLVCDHVPEPGPGQPSGPSHNFDINQAYYGGPARGFDAKTNSWSSDTTFWVDIMAKDHGEPGNKAGPGNHGSMGPDYYHFTARLFVSATQSGAVVYDTAGDFDGGNFQIHPPNNGHPYTPVPLPPWVMQQP
jgi:hypothetical protein